MVIYLSNFATHGRHENSVSIAVGTPSWFMGDRYDHLFPSWDIVIGSKNGQISHDEYTLRYVRRLNALDPHQVAKDLNNKILLCWCKNGAFCHRHIVGRWLKLYIPDIKIENI